MSGRGEGRILISTDDLELAGGLREAFQEAGFTVELVTPSEELRAAPAPSLLILTAGSEDAATRPQVLQARKALRIPVFLVGGEALPPAARSEFTECFPRDSHPGEIQSVAHALLERLEVQKLTGIVGESDAIKEVIERILQIAPVGSRVLITGESGTGKELVARGIHDLSQRRHKPFIAVNVAALAETLLESELFGHEKGAFTGAIDSRKGLFELAHGGTIFLDEIGEMPLVTQTKLLRVLEQREFLRVGGERTIKVDIRIVAATNQDLRQLVAIGQFRKDLYYRLNVLHIDLPPLRRRREDIPLLVASFVAEVSARHDRPFVGISAEAMDILQRHYWPGNVRELENLVESMVVLAPGRMIVPADIPAEVASEQMARGVSPVPVGLASTAPTTPERGSRPELEFIFRTLVDLRMDVDDLRTEFEAYRGSGGGLSPVEALQAGGELREVGAHDEVESAPWKPAPDMPVETVSEVISVSEPGVGGPLSDEPQPGHLVLPPDLTMEQIEREAIGAALEKVQGNRRKAAEVLDIGERTLYRKIKKYGLDD
ncbi:MAG: sigma-54-dependent Fis family transcriptional regulator [Gemmatimonadota bacterium]|nr:MAG: sigma-54-dependent Fis family transcriptional regulator [Gemmatimonadota bacterium]